MELSPKQVVSELDKYIISQSEAKKAVAIALRNRYRRSKLEKNIREEVTPKNIIMKGPTGVGKTEIARRLAKLVNAPFVKVEATKFTEVGYVGRDVESMVRDLVEASILLVKQERYEEVKQKSEDFATEKLVSLLCADRTLESQSDCTDIERKEKIRENLKSGIYADKQVEIEVTEPPKQFNVLSGAGMEFNMSELFDDVMGRGKKKKKRTSVSKAKDILVQEESDRLIDLDSVQTEAIKRAEENGIIFIDEIDKISGKGNSSGPDVSREGVQRDILPIVEGCTVLTKYGPIKTDYILFIAAGAFHISKIEDLIPELQGRFPVTVELNSLKREDFIDILTKTTNSLILQYTSLLAVDKINLTFTDEAIQEISRIAELENETSENIGARRLHSVMELLLEEISFNASGDHPPVAIEINEEYIKAHLGSTLKAYNLKKYML